MPNLMGFQKIGKFSISSIEDIENYFYKDGEVEIEITKVGYLEDGSIQFEQKYIFVDETISSTNIITDNVWYQKICSNSN